MGNKGFNVEGKGEGMNGGGQKDREKGIKKEVKERNKGIRGKG